MSTSESPAAHEISKPLTVAIVGAGLGGLAAAIALRRQGHIVTVLEASTLNKEIGAAIGVPPNAMRVLEAFGYEQRNLRSCEYRGIVWHSTTTGEAYTTVFKDQASNYGFQGCLCLRTALHEELKRLAMREDAPGNPVQVKLGIEIVHCDPEVGILTGKTGEKYEADVIIAADGIRSTLRTFVVGHTVVAPPTGICAFRWITDVSKFAGRPELDWVLKEGVPGGRLVAAPGQEGHFFLYPCQDGTRINVTMMHPDRRDQDKHDWYARATRAEMLEEYDGFPEPFRAFLELAEETVNLWQLRVLPLLPTWTRGRLALLGDAAHATFPTLGQGAAMAVDYAAALGVMLPQGTRREDVSARLEAYQQVRKKRGEFVNTESFEQATVGAKRGLYGRSLEMQDQLNGYDAIRVAQEHFDKIFGSEKPTNI